MTGGLVPYVALALALLLTLAVVMGMAWSLGVLRQPRALVERGHWREAAVAAERLGASWLRVFASVREEAAYARAACLHLEGRFDASLDAIAALRDEGGGLKGRFANAVALLEGANLVMAGIDAARAGSRLRAACGAEALPEDLLFLALATLASGDAEGAEAVFERAGRERPGSAPSPRIYEPAFRYLRGLYLVRTARAEEAAPELEAAAESPIVTVYVERARALVLRRAAGEDGDGRSSLTPQVIDE